MHAAVVKAKRRKVSIEQPRSPGILVENRGEKIGSKAPKGYEGVEGRGRSTHPALFLEVLGVDVDITLPLIGDFIERKYGLNGAGGHAGATVDALVRVDIEHLFRLEVTLVLAGMDAVDGTNVNA